MTAVASPPTLQPLPRLSWNSSNGTQSALSAEDVSRMLVSKKGPQRTNSSSSLSSSSSTSSKGSDSTVTNEESTTGKEPPVAAKEKEGWGSSKFSRGFWAQSKPETNNISGNSVSALNGRAQVNGTSNSGAVAVTTPSALSQTPVATSQKMVQPQPQANGVRVPMPPAGSDPPALLVLLPMNGTFERKQINVPLFPDILRIGRQTNAKTVPTSTNGYFDSKVLSRQHAEVWADRSGKIWIRDVKSSNGTFVNGMRLSPESRDSEPHELRENDVLELGIDIVSEDQKSIVHHKVSAKVEHAGIPSNTTSVLDLNLGDIEPGSGGGLSMLPQNMQMRGRLGSQGSVTSNGRGAPYGLGANNLNGLGVQRHMGAWMGPVTIEQVVKRLGVELRYAKQQSQELNRAGQYVNALLNSEPGQELPKPPADILPPPPMVNGISPQKAEILSPFSGPPAPPPQLPLPEKPDAARSMSGDSSSPAGLKRIETEKLGSANGFSPGKLDSPSTQITGLLQELRTTREELRSQDRRVRLLEDQLKQERKARETAEERARNLFNRSRLTNGTNLTHEHDGPDDNVSIQSDDSHVTTILCPEDTDNDLPDTASSNIAKMQKGTTQVETSASRLQERLDHMLREMEDMKTQLEFHKHRADTAEKDRVGLAEMVERIRQGESPKAKSREGSLKKRRSTEMATQTDAMPLENGSADLGEKSDGEEETVERANGTVDKSRAQARQLQHALATALTLHDERVIQSAPYASIVGVVLIGVGIMTYLNGWQKIEH